MLIPDLNLFFHLQEPVPAQNTPGLPQGQVFQYLANLWVDYQQTLCGWILWV